MPFDNPFQSPGIWLKGNLHTHTTVSDGRLSPQERVDAYRAEGYDFLAFTDHDRTVPLETVQADGLVLISGIEIVCANPLGGPAYHMVGLNVPAGFAIPPGHHVQTVVDAINQAGGLAVIAHPYWCGQNVRDLEVIADAVGIEVFNTTCLRSIGKGTSAVHWDGLLAQGRELMGFAVDDVHRETADAFQGWIVARCRDRSAEAVMDAVARGCFYASCGPSFEDFQVDGATLAVRTSPVACINFVCDGSKGRHVRGDDGEPITEASFTLRGGERYVRIECVDASGRAAWLNPTLLG